MRKRDAWWQALARESQRRKVALPKLPPVLCALSAGDPVEAREAHWLRPIEGSPGCYEGPPSGTFRLVVLSQLPRTRATLVARSMGAAIQQLCATRGLKLTATWRAKLDAETRAEVLMRWLARAVTAAKAREIFSDA